MSTAGLRSSPAEQHAPKAPRPAGLLAQAVVQQPHGNNPSVKPLWDALYAANADVVLAGHDHDYKRFAPQTPGGSADTTRGIREFVVGTGGKEHYSISSTKPNSRVHNTDIFGVLRLTLHPDGYDWRFLPEAGQTFTGSCHRTL